jgi:hypothetical protein
MGERSLLVVIVGATMMMTTITTGCARLEDVAAKLAPETTFAKGAQLSDPLRRDSVAAALRKAGPRGIAVCRRVLDGDSASENQRVFAIEVLGAVRDEADAPRVAAHLGSSAPAVRMAATTALLDYYDIDRVGGQLVAALLRETNTECKILLLRAGERMTGGIPEDVVQRVIESTTPAEMERTTIFGQLSVGVGRARHRVPRLGN